MSDLGSAESVENVYAERNQAALAFAWMAADRGWRVGYTDDDPDWPVLLVETPAGQVSWHLKRSELPTWVPRFPDAWDGHTTAEKDERLNRIIGARGGFALTARSGR